MKRTQKLIAAAAFAVALSTGAAFADDMMQTAYGNTIVVSEPNGAVLRYHFNADGTFDLVLPDARVIPGTYEVTGGQICLTPTGGQRGCAPYAGHKNVGDSWTQAGTQGQTINVQLVAGR